MPPHHALGQWEPHLQGSHISILELQAAFNALRHFCSLIHNKHVLIHSDGRPTFPASTTRSQTRCLMAKSIQQSGLYIGGWWSTCLLISKDRTSTSSRRGEHLFAEIQKPNINPFTSAENAQLPVFCTRFFHPKAWVSDALQIDWIGMSVYAFPPISLIPLVLSKVERELCCLLFAPSGCISHDSCT